MYDGTLYGQWEAIVTFQQMIVLCDADGIVDITPQAISARTSIPLEIIKKGLGILEAPDPYSRTPDQEGRRIELIDAHRPWGWHIVNHEKYQAMQDSDTVRAQTRERVRRHRKLKAGLPDEDLSCAYCGADAVGPDHIVPTSLGGSNDPENVVPCCFKCNQHKGQQDVSDFVNNPRYSWVNMDLVLSNPKLKHLVTARNGSKRHTDTDTDTRTTTAANEKISLSAEGMWQSVSAKQTDLWRAAYPAVNLDAELAAAAAWIIANPKNKKSNYARYITNWLKRAQDRAPRLPSAPQRPVVNL